MRKQYHLRPSRMGPGMDAWDVDRLITLSHNLPVQSISLSAIHELDEPYWYQEPESHPPTCRSILGHMRLVQQADLRFPIILDPEGRVMDGMHRIVKAALEGHTHVLAQQLPSLPAPDYTHANPDDLPYES